MSDKIYMQNILDHFHNPENYGCIAEFTHSFEVKNLSCGDVLKVWLLVEDSLVKKIGFEGNGCAISQASMSILGEELLGMNVEEISKLDKDYLVGLLGIELSHTRLKCALMSLEVVKKALC